MIIRQIVLDTETTGLAVEEGHRLIEVGGLEMINRRFTGRKLHYYVNPERDIDEGAVNIHGITHTMLQDKPLFAEISAELLDFIHGAELIIHNAPFDIGFLNYELKRSNSDNPLVTDICRVIDTLVLARQKHPGQANNLDALCRRYAVDNSDRELHGALIDAKLLALVYLAMTGGQTQLFAQEQYDVQHTNAADPVLRRRSAVGVSPLPIVPLNSVEHAAHDAFLAAMKAKGSCLWD